MCIRDSDGRLPKTPRLSFSLSTVEVPVEAAVIAAHQTVRILAIAMKRMLMGVGFVRFGSSSHGGSVGKRLSLLESKLLKDGRKERAADESIGVRRRRPKESLRSNTSLATDEAC